jgi:hypothetical protein
VDDKVIEELSAVLRKHSPNFFADSDGGIIHHDMKTGRIHMVEVRAFDVTEVPHADAARADARCSTPEAIQGGCRHLMVGPS